MNDYIQNNSWPLPDLTEAIVSKKTLFYVATKTIFDFFSKIKMSNVTVKNVFFTPPAKVNFVDNVGIQLEVSGLGLTLDYTYARIRKQLEKFKILN